MANQIGKRYKCIKCGSEFIVTKGGTGTITCCGQPMEQKKQQETIRMANQSGKRYKCSVCGTEVLCTKAGDGETTCCGKPIEELKARPIPSSD